MVHSISNRNFCCFSYIIDMVHQNSPTVEFLQDKIEGNLRRANTEPSVDFRRANTEPSVDFRKANTGQSVNFRRANTETYCKSESKSRKGQGFPRAGRAAPRDFPRALPSRNPSEQPCQPSENPVLPSSFT